MGKVRIASSSLISLEVSMKPQLNIRNESLPISIAFVCSGGVTLASMSNGKDIQVFPEQSQVADALANLTIQAAERAIGERGTFTVALAGGSLIKLLSGLKGKSEIDWENWHVFWVDERCVPHE